MTPKEFVIWLDEFLYSRHTISASDTLTIKSKLASVNVIEYHSPVYRPNIIPPANPNYPYIIKEYLE